MPTTSIFTRPVTAITAIACCLVFLASCSSSQNTTDKATPTPNSSNEQNPPKIEGLLSSSSDKNQYTVTIHNPADGKTIRTMQLPTAYKVYSGDHDKALAERQQFSSDFSAFAWEKDDNIHVAKLVGNSYKETAKWEGRDTFDKLKPKYATPAFHPVTGRLWFGEVNQTVPLTDTPVRVWSVDPNDANSQPQAEKQTRIPFQFAANTEVPSYKYLQYPQTNDGVGVYFTSSQMISAYVDATLRKANATTTIKYECPIADSKTTLLCYSASSDQPFGSIARLSFAKSVPVLTKVVKAASHTLNDCLFSPDRKTALLKVDTLGWYSVDLTQKNAEPSKVDLQLQKNNRDETPTIRLWV